VALCDFYELDLNGTFATPPMRTSRFSTDWTMLAQVTIMMIAYDHSLGLRVNHICFSLKGITTRGKKLKT
jgi:hypothetical protein